MQFNKIMLFFILIPINTEDFLSSYSKIYRQLEIENVDLEIQKLSGHSSWLCYKHESDTFIFG